MIIDKLSRSRMPLHCYRAALTHKYECVLRFELSQVAVDRVLLRGDLVGMGGDEVAMGREEGV